MESKVSCCVHQGDGAGQAVVATDVGGVQDLLGATDGEPIQLGRFKVAERRILVRSEDADGLAVVLEALVSDIRLRHQLQDRARPYVLRTYTSERLVRDISSLHEALTREDRCTY